MCALDVLWLRVNTSKVPPSKGAHKPQVTERHVSQHTDLHHAHMHTRISFYSQAMVLDPDSARVLLCTSTICARALSALAHLSKCWEGNERMHRHVDD
jgi:hypothetical protein